MVYGEMTIPKLPASSCLNDGSHFLPTALTSLLKDKFAGDDWLAPHTASLVEARRTPPALSDSTSTLR